MSTPTRNIRLPVAVGAALARCVPAGLVGFALLAGGAAQAQSPGIALATRSTLAQAGQPATLSPATQAPAPAPQAAEPHATVAQPIQLRAGGGMLLQLPQPASTVMSAEPGIARVQPASPTSLFLMGVAEGRTTVVATNAAGAAIVMYDVTVAPGSARPATVAASGGPAPAAASTGVSEASARAVQAAVAQTVQGATDVRARAAGSDIVLSGTIPTAAAMQQAVAIARAYVGDKGGVVNEVLVLDSIQVNVRVRIAEINRQITRQLGFNWQALGNGTNWRFGLLTGAAVAGPISPLLGLGLTPLSGASAAPNQIGAGFTSGPWDVNSVIDALAGDQLISILAEPNLTAQSGETASFLAGGEFPIPTAATTSSGAPTITVEFKPFGVSLAVIPTVLASNRLNLRIRPEVSQLSNNGAISVPLGNGTVTIPALTVRRVETTIELGSGQSFAIAGLLEKTSTNGTNGLPYLGEVPVLGALFRSNNFQQGESELVIIVTPYLVSPASSPSVFHLPTDGFKPATDLDRILLGRQMSQASTGSRALDAGFILK